MLLTHPEIPTCQECMAWMHDKHWKRNRRADQDVPRPKGSPTPCHLCPKSLDRATPNPRAELTARNQQTYQVYLQIKAGRPMPDDPIVHHNCGLIRWVEDEVERSARAMPLTLMAAMLGRK